MNKRLFKNASLVGALAISITGSANAFAADGWLDYQAVWQLGTLEKASQAGWVKPGKEIYRIPLLPVRLFEVPETISISGGSVLLSKGSQLILMESKKYIACSLERGSKNTLSEKNRVCLIDSDLDGVFDSYLLRSFRAGFYGGEGQNYALAGKFNEDIRSIGSIKLLEIDPKLYLRAPHILLTFGSISDKSQSFLTYTSVGNLYALGRTCNSFVAEGGPESSLSCNEVGANLRVTARKGKEFLFSISEQRKSQKIRFEYIKGMLDYRVVSFEIYDF